MRIGMNDIQDVVHQPCFLVLSRFTLQGSRQLLKPYFIDRLPQSAQGPLRSRA